MASNDTDAVYSRAGMKENRVGYGERPAVLVVDVQKGMTDPENPLGSELDEMVTNVVELLDAARAGDAPVVFSRVVYTHEDAVDSGIWTRKISSLSSLASDSNWVEIDDRLDVRPSDHVLDKRQASAFHESELDSMLTAQSIDTLVVAGCSTSGCVRATVNDACAHGYRTILPEGCLGDRSVEQHRANIYDMDAKYADLRPLSEVADYLRSSEDAG